ncbi:MAG: PDZ domain-containing protein, partial [Calditrichales bacterium]
GLEKPIGVFISNVLPGKAADKAGIVAGDVILKVEGKDVNQPNQLQALVGAHNPGDKISLQVWRDGKKRDFTIKLEGREEQAVAAKEDKPKKQEKVGLLGIQLRDMEAQELRQFELDNGIIILDVDQTSPAAKEGLRRGDVIFKIDGEKVESVSEFQDYLNDKKAGAILKIQIRSRYSDGSTSDRLVFLQIPK